MRETALPPQESRYDSEGLSTTFVEMAKIPSALGPISRAMRALVVASSDEYRKRLPSTEELNRNIERKLAAENIKRGRQGQTNQMKIVEQTTKMTCCATIAHGPNPSTARAIAAIALTAVATITLISRLLKFMSRVRSARCVASRELRTNIRETTMKRSLTSGSPKNAATGAASAMPIMVKHKPEATDAQKDVERSTSANVFRWIRAAPRARSEKTRT